MFWQATGLGLLSTLGVVKDVSVLCSISRTHRTHQSKYMAADEINIGIAAILETFEMTSVLSLSFIFVLLFIQADSIASSHSFMSRPSHTGHTALKHYTDNLLQNGPSV